MAQKLGFLNQWMFGQWAGRAAINHNADELTSVVADVSSLRIVVEQQSQEILKLRAMLMGALEVLQRKAPFDDAELESAVQTAWTDLTAPSGGTAATDHPYRGRDPSPEEIAAAEALLVAAQDHHFSKRFQDARVIYQQIIDEHGHTTQAAQAREQLENLRNA